MTIAKGAVVGLSADRRRDGRRPRRRRADRQGRRVRPRLHLFRPPGRLRRRDRQPAASSQRESLVERVRDEIAPYLAAKLARAGRASAGRRGALRRPAWRAIELVPDKASRQLFRRRAARSGTICRDYLLRATASIMRAVRDTMIVAPPLVITRRRSTNCCREGLALPRPDTGALPGRRAPVSERGDSTRSAVI